MRQVEIFSRVVTDFSKAKVAKDVAALKDEINHWLLDNPKIGQPEMLPLVAVGSMLLITIWYELPRTETG